MKELDVTMFTAIENSDGTIQLSDLLKDDGSLRGEPALHFKEIEGGFWDNDEWVFKFLRGLKKNKNKQKEKLKKFCNKNKLDYKLTKEHLLEIFIMSKRLGWWSLTKK